mgnify:FL=1
MPKGNVKWFDPKRGYGFIQPEDGSKDVFVDLAALKRAGLATLQEGQKVEFRVTDSGSGRRSAINLSIASAGG